MQIAPGIETIVSGADSIESTAGVEPFEAFPLSSVSLVIPVYNEVESLSELYRELVETLEPLGLDWEIIFVDDGSSDGSARLLRTLHAHDPRVQVVEFRRNFGKSAALAAGFAAAGGEAVVTLDADLQDVPAEIPRLLDELRGGADLVSGWKSPRSDPLSKRLPSSLFNAAVRALTGMTLHDFNCGLKAYRAEVLDEIHIYGELHRYIPVLAEVRGFRVAEVKVRHRSRRFGRSKFGAGRFARGFFDLLTIMFLTQYNRRPLHFFGWFGVAGLLLGLLINGYLATIWFMGSGIGTRPLLTLGVLLMIIGAQFVLFGLLAEMIANARPGHDYSIRRHLVSRHLSTERPSDDDLDRA